ncbi:hypothetical protein HPU229313_07615, partial [Helicobacter pullorum]
SFTSQIGVFGNIIEDSSKAQITIKNLIIDGINIDSTVDNSGYIGGFAGYINGGNFSNIILKNIGSISSVGLGGTSFDIGGFAGWIYGSTFSNIILKNIGSISNIGSEGASFDIGGFAGQVVETSFSDIVLENFGTISSIIDNERSDGVAHSFVGGFIGRSWVGNSFSNIVLNNIGAIKSKFSSDDARETIEVYSGGFIGSIESGVGIFSNIILNNIGDITSEIDADNKGAQAEAKSFAGGFVGCKDSVNPTSIETFSNIYLYFNPNATILAEITDRGKGEEGFGKFYGSLRDDTTFDNINLYYNDNPNLGLNNPIKNANSDSKNYYSTSNPDGQIFLHAYSDSSQGIKDFSSALESANSSVFKDNPILWNQDSNGNYNYYFANLVTFDSSSWLTKDDFNQSILNEILENLSFDILSLITDTNSLESALQSLDFLLHFINADKSGESGISLGNGIYGLMGYTLNQSQIDLLNSNNLLITQKLISSINSLSLEDKHYIQEYKQKLESYQAKAKEFEESLKVISSDKHQALIEAFKQENGYYSLLDDRDRAEKIIKTAINNGEFNLNNPYKIANGINVSFNLNTIEGINDKDGLNPDFTLPSANSSLFVKENIEDVLILPAQEKQEAIVEDGKERGRLCIVSDNAKTNNPCMAITYY